MPDDNAPTPGPDDAQARRNRLIGRLILVAFGILLLAYIIPIFVRPHAG